MPVTQRCNYAGPFGQRHRRGNGRRTIFAPSHRRREVSRRDFPNSVATKESLELDRLSPLEALQKLYELRSRRP